MNSHISMKASLIICLTFFSIQDRSIKNGWGDEFLDAIVEFNRPSGSHFSGKPHENVLGAPDTRNVNIDTPESIIVAFIDNIVIDGPGDDLLVVEHVGGDSSVNIFGSADGILYEFLTQTNTDVRIDLADYSLKTLKYLRLDGLGNGGTTPGYEFDAAVALNSKDVEFFCPTTDYHLNTVISFDQSGLSHDDGQSLAAVLGRPDSISISVDTPEVLEVAFSDIEVVDGPGNDLFIYEHVNLDSTVRIFGAGPSPGVGTGGFVFLAETDRSIGIDLADYDLDTLKYLRFVGMDDGGDVPGFELDGAVAINFECLGVLIGDTNLDSKLDLLDVTPFVFYLTTGIYQPQADVNGDGTVDLLDVQPFVGLIN